MKSIEELAALGIQRWLPWTCSWYPSKPATDESVLKIENLLKFTIPPDFVKLSRLAHNYGVWFGSIGDDYDSHAHLLRLNEAFHKPEDSAMPLPAHWVLINHGHDGDLHCIDLNSKKNGDYSVYYVDVDSPSEPDLMATSFNAYLDWLVHR